MVEVLYISMFSLGKWRRVFFQVKELVFWWIIGNISKYYFLHIIFKLLYQISNLARYLGLTIPGLKDSKSRAQTGNLVNIAIFDPLDIRASDVPQRRTPQLKVFIVKSRFTILFIKSFYPIPEAINW